MAEGTIAPEAARRGHRGDAHRAAAPGGEQLAAAIRAADLDAAPVPDQPWFEGRTRWTLRWYALHQIEEHARHAGHADILRESIDGRAPTS